MSLLFRFFNICLYICTLIEAAPTAANTASKKARAPSFPAPLYPYPDDDNNTALLNDFVPYLTYSYSSNCKSIWTRQQYPQGNNFEKQFPTTLVKGLFDSETTFTAFIAYNDVLKSIIISFRPSCTLTLWKKDFQLWRSSFTAAEFGDLVEENGEQDAHKNTSAPSDSSSSSSPLSFPGFLLEDAFNTSSASFKIPSGLSVHHGFKVLYQKFRTEVLTLTKELAIKFPNYKVVFTGHSLGASVAEVAAVDFAINGNAPDRLWLFPFASPRTGNKKWAIFVQNLEFARLGRIQRLSKFRDPFTSLPFQFMNYQHVGQEHILWDNNTITKCPPNPNGSMECKIGHLSLLWSNPNLHAPRFYMQFLGLEFDCDAKPNDLALENQLVAEQVRRRAAELVVISKVTKSI